MDHVKVMGAMCLIDEAFSSLQLGLYERLEALGMCAMAEILECENGDKAAVAEMFDALKARMLAQYQTVEEARLQVQAEREAEAAGPAH